MITVDVGQDGAHTDALSVRLPTIKATFEQECANVGSLELPMPNVTFGGCRISKLIGGIAFPSNL